MSEQTERVPVQVRIDAAIIKKLDGRAKLEKRTRADVIRLILEYGLQNMPQGWVR